LANYVVLWAQAFDDCTTLAATFKLLESFEGLLERDAIAAELAKKHVSMVTAFADDVKEVQELFHAHQEFPQLSKNSPPHSGKYSSVRKVTRGAVRS
jgi:dynein heavy chain